MKVRHNVMSQNTYRNLAKNESALSKNLEKLSSGYKINRAGDDAAGLSISEKMRSQITGIDAAAQNTKDAIGMIQTAEGALDEVHDMMNRISYLLTLAENGTYDEKIDRRALDDEIQALLDEIDRIAETANFNGKNVLDGSLGTYNFKIGDSAMTEDVLNMQVALSGIELAFSPVPPATGAPHTLVNGDIRHVVNGNALPYPKNQEGRIRLSKNLVYSRQYVSKLRGAMGATQNRLEHTINNLGTMKENLTESESTIRDTDVADEMMSYTKNNILSQSAQAMLAQANQVPQNILQLMQ